LKFPKKAGEGEKRGIALRAQSSKRRFRGYATMAAEWRITQMPVGGTIAVEEGREGRRQKAEGRRQEADG